MPKKGEEKVDYNETYLAEQLAEAANISSDDAMRVLEVLGIKKLVENYNAAATLVNYETTRRALGIPSIEGRLLPDFTFANLGLVMHDRFAALRDVSR